MPVLTPDQLRKLFAWCSGKRFIGRRDDAILRLFADTRLRLSERAPLTVADVDLDEKVAVVLGKGRHPRAVPFGAKTTAALDRYLRVHSSRLPRLDGRRDCLDGNPASCDQGTVDSIPSG